VDDVYIKTPSQLGLDDYHRYIRQAQTTALDIRALEDSERFERLEETLERYPDLRTLGHLKRELVHFLAVHRLQYERLRAHASPNIPLARFAFLQSGWPFPKFEPALFQERVAGPTLWEMFDFSALEVPRRWWPYLSAISSQLSKLLDSGLLNHIDWNIQNFVFREADQRLFYVDMKPTTFVAIQGNTQNLHGIREYFVE